MTIYESKSNLIESVCQHIRKNYPLENGRLDVFTHHFFKRAPIESIQKMGISELVHIVQEAWDLFQVRKPTEYLIKVKAYQIGRHKTPRFGIFMVNMDQPFLIDSITEFLTRKGIESELMVHPVLGVQRSKQGQLVALVDLIEKQHFATDKAHGIADDFQTESIAFIQFKANLNKKQVSDIQKELDLLLTQVRCVVSDWSPIQDQIRRICDHVTTLPPAVNLSMDQRPDLKDLLNWLEHGHFIFLGSRYFAVKPRLGESAESPSILCLEKDLQIPNFGIFLDDHFMTSDDLVPVSGRVRILPEKSAPISSELPTLSITKTNARSTVHRHSRIDSIEIIDWNHEGKVEGLYQFVGIFTSRAFVGSAFNTPLVSRKVRKVFARFGLDPQWHDGKMLISILNSIPRDELFYLDEDQIYEISQNVLNMNDKHSLSLLLRPDIYGRYITIMVFLPKEKYSFDLKERFKRILQEKFQGKISSGNVLLGELDYARLIFVVSFSSPTLLDYQTTDVKQALLEAALSWEDHLEHILNQEYTEEEAATLLATYQDSFPSAYVEAFTPDQAVIDIGFMEKIQGERPIDFYLYKQKDQNALKIKIFHASYPLSLSTLLPILQNLGFKVIGETSYSLTKEECPIWIHDFEVFSLTDSHGLENWKSNQENLISAFHHIWEGTVENDSLHQLILKAGFNVRQVTLMRAYLKFLWQVQLPYSLGYVKETLSDYPNITRNFVDLFELRFSLNRTQKSQTEETRLMREIDQLLQGVDRLDHDRILRRVLNAILATIRTNYYQTTSTGEEKPYLSFKFDCRKLEDLPEPRPLYEIFVYSPRVEAIHLRGGKVARGGIRWSDRPEDFRTEILGLMKAQTIKNAVAVPLGSKGGFVIKHQSSFTDRKLLMAEVISCYKVMMSGLLDLTDNLVNGQVVHPPQVACFDEDDPYLVVAADKGTAEFSDIANAVSADYGFWLDDAFASGGSEGYDHKKIAITARGAWEAVKRHFRELHHDIQATPFTVVGVGDMNGDVFGNGMLRSKKIRLLAAFNHEHIFIDPDPDPETSYLERKRLFDMPRSTWKDYDTKFISKGGDVFDRMAKTIHLSSEACQLFEIADPEISPDALIQHLLCSSVDLLYFGGIGTFIKASTETHADVGDRANNEIRVDAKAVRCKVVGEGANLGMTQRGRIEYALKGGCLNTDGIDNSAGVDCSDHEVNLKILFSMMGNSLSRDQRNQLLRDMTDDVALSVLANNYRQTQILTVLEAAKVSGINACQSLMRILETENALNRDLEGLPDDETLERRRGRNQGMTRPELSVLLGYSKIALYEKILGSPLPDAAAYRPWLEGYFPKIIQERFAKEIHAHPLRREITATVLTNEIINRVGPMFVYEVAQTTGATLMNVIKAFFLACDGLNLNNLWEQIDCLDALMVPDAQTFALIDITHALEEVVLWFLRHPHVTRSDFKDLQTLLVQLPGMLHGDQRHLFEARLQGFIHMEVPQVIAQNLSLIPFYPYLLDILSLSMEHKDSTVVAQTYFMVRSKIGLDWLMTQAEEIHVDAEWQRSARTSLIDDLIQIQAKLTHSVMTEHKDGNVEAWMRRHEENIHHVTPILAQIKSAGRADLSMLGYAIRQLQHLGS